MEKLVVYQARSYDAERIVELMRLLVEQEGEACTLTAKYVEKKYLLTKGSHILLAGRGLGTDPLGMLSFSIRPDLFHGAPSCLIETLVVRPQARGSGVGSALMAECLAIARKAGCAEASVSTMQDNLKAIEFYKKHGFEDGALFLEVHF